VPSTLPAALLQRLEREPIKVRVAAAKDKLSAGGGKPPPALANAEQGACDQVITEAGEWVAVHIIDW
jgi:hypothetical protein